MNKKAIALAIILVIGSGTAILFQKMTLYMGLFFIIFSIFKLVDIKGFANGFQKYDIIAKKSRTYAIIYPFVELALGILFILNLWIFVAGVVTLFIMGVGAIGVFQAIQSKQKFTCACLGTKLGIPLTYVTLFENLIMIIMAIILIV